MIDGLKPYPEYRASGLPWLETIPLDWNVARTKTLFRLRTEKSVRGHGQQLLSIYTHIGVRPRKDMVQQGNKASTTDGYWIVKRGDIIVNKLLAWMGAVGVSHYDGVTSPAYDILRPVAELQPDYFHELLRTKIYLQLFKSRSRGIMDMRLRLYFDQLGQIPLLIPPPDEQAAIVRFLDYASGRIERAIRAKRKVIGLLNEQKQAIIHRAVTRGLDPTVPLKPSGIPWLGDIPQHWDVQSVRRRGRVQGGKALAANAPGTQRPYLRVANVFDGRIDASQTNTMPFSDAEFEHYRLVVNDLLLNEGQSIELVGRTARYLGDPPDCAFQNSLIRVQAGDRTMPEFLEVLFRHAQHTGIFATISTQTTSIAHLGVSRLANLMLAFPPISEQKEIITHVDVEIAPLRTAIDRTEREISLLREYRTRLVADVVTGQLDVREAARHLPAESIEPELAPDPEELTELEEAEA